MITFHLTSHSDRLSAFFAFTCIVFPTLLLVNAPFLMCVTRQISDKRSLHQFHSTDFRDSRLDHVTELLSSFLHVSEVMDDGFYSFNVLSHLLLRFFTSSFFVVR